MKITRIETIPIRVPLKPEFAIRSGRGGAHTVSPFLLVKVHTDAGLTGVGEASCTPRWSGEDQFTAEHLIRTYLEPLLVGEDPRDVPTLTARFRLAFAANYFTKAAVEMALWDLAGKAAGVPVYALLGGKVRESIATKWSISGLEPPKAAEIARWAMAEGFRAMKVKVGIDLESDVARVAAVRAVVGSSVKLGVDANGGWPTPSVATATIARLREHGIAFVEQPLPPEEDAQLPELRAQLGLPLVADESIYTFADAAMLARIGAVDAFSIYVGKAGGIGPAKAIADFAERAGIRCTVGSNLELGVGSAAMIHLALATRGITAEDLSCDIIGPYYYQDDIVREPLPMRGGQAHAFGRPGLGVELDEEKVARYRAAASQPSANNL